jgi:PAS domain S-box-containing protein
MDYSKEIQKLKGQIEKLQADKNDYKELAQQQQQTAQQLQLVIDLSETGTWEWNVQTGETVFNSQWAAMLGYKLNELQPISIETWMKFTHPDDLKIAQQQLDKYFKHETTLYEAEFRMKHRDGHWVWVLDRGQVAHWTPDGKPLLMFGTHQNISNIKYTEIELKKEEARLESLLKISQHPAHTVQELLDFALEEAIALTASKIGYIYFYDEGKKEFTLNTWSKEVMQQCHVLEPRTIYSLDKTGIWGEAVRQAKPIVVNNFTASNPLKKGVPEGHAPLHKFLTIPVFDEGKIVAVVGVANKADDYDQSDIRQLTLMMDTVWKIVLRKETEQKLKKANRLYAVISQVNQAIVHNRSRQKLLEEICRVAIDFGKFSMAWIGLLNNETDKVEPVAFAGEEKGYLSEIFQITLDKKLGGAGPVGTSIRTNRYFVCNDIANDPAMLFWKDEALKRNYRSVIGLPLCLYGKPIAALAIYSDQIHFFNPEEIKLLEEVAYDIGYALDAIETEAEHKKAEEQVLQSEAKFRNLMNQMQLGMAVHEIILDNTGQPVDYRFWDCNPAFEKLTGLKRDNILGKTILEILPSTEKIWIDKYGKVAITGQSIAFENYARELNRYYSVKAYQPSPMQFAVIIEDITVQKQALKNLETSNQKFQLLSKAATEMLSMKTLDEIYTYITSSLHSQYPDAVILFLLVDEEKNKSKLIEIKGIDNKLVNKTIQLAGFDFTKLEFNLISDHFRHFKSG